ncbi:glycosyltransferase [Myxococcota bacterium]
MLLVSKPVSPPFRDGTLCLARDLARHTAEHRMRVMGVAGVCHDWVGDGLAEVLPVYSGAGSFAPSLRSNARAAWWLATRAEADVWHLLFAPNRRTTAVSKVLKRWRRVPIVQTITSPPRTFQGISSLLLGDVVVAQSEWTRRQVLAEDGGWGGRPLEVIHPSVPEMMTPAADRVRAARAELGVSPEVPLILYPGDLETSVGAQTVESIMDPVCERLGQAVIVFAFRAKTPLADRIAQALVRRIDPGKGRVAGAVSDMPALLAAATAVVFPVDDLRGKVDLPVVLLESMSLGVPVIVYDWGPLSELRGVVQVPAYDRTGLVEAVVRVAEDSVLRGRISEEQRRAVRERHWAGTVARRYEALYGEVLRGRTANPRERIRHR